MLKKLGFQSILLLIVIFTVSCGSSEKNANSYTIEKGTTPVTETASFHGTYNLKSIYSGDLSIMSATGKQYINYTDKTIKLELTINTMLDSYTIQREYPIEFDGYSFSLLDDIKERYESENSSSKGTYFIRADYLAEMPEFKALLNIEWQKVSDRII